MDDKRQLAPNDDRTDGNDGYTNPIARKGEQQFACIMRNRSGVSSGEIDFGARFIDRLCDGDQQSAVNSAFAIYEKWSRETGKVAQRDTRKSLEKDFAYHADLCTSQQARIATLEAQQRWISVSERLPDDGGVYYVIKRGDREPTQSLFDKDFGTFMGPVLYWIDFSLPEPPEQETTHEP